LVLATIRVSIFLYLEYQERRHQNSYASILWLFFLFPEIGLMNARQHLVGFSALLSVGSLAFSSVVLVLPWASRVLRDETSPQSD
jgi:ABC-type uncharacterized transport system YnjBCD permease subunit